MPRNGAGIWPRERSASSFSRHRQISRDQTVRIIELFRPSLRHKAIIDRFGRFPHRNAILGRESTADEIEFLKQPGSGF
jgi:uncharacterized protein (DUF924 family)